MLEPSIHDRMREFLHVCYGREHNLLNDREVDSPDGGRIAYFIDKSDGFRFASVETADDGLIYLMLSNRSDGSDPICDSYDYSTDFFETLIKRIQHFLAEGHEDVTVEDHPLFKWKRDNVDFVVAHAHQHYAFDEDAHEMIAWGHDYATVRKEASEKRPDAKLLFGKFF